MAVNSLHHPAIVKLGIPEVPRGAHHSERYKQVIKLVCRSRCPCPGPSAPTAVPACLQHLLHRRHRLAAAVFQGTGLAREELDSAFCASCRRGCMGQPLASSPRGLKSRWCHCPHRKGALSTHVLGLLTQVVTEHLVLAHVGGVTHTAVCGRAAASAAPIHQAGELLRTRQNRCRWLVGCAALSALKVLASKMRTTSTQVPYLATNCNRSLMPDDRMMASLPTRWSLGCMPWYLTLHTLLVKAVVVGGTQALRQLLARHNAHHPYGVRAVSPVSSRWKVRRKRGVPCTTVRSQAREASNWKHSFIVGASP